MDTNYIRRSFLLAIFISLHFYLSISFAQESASNQNRWRLETISKLEARLQATNVSIQETKNNIERCDATISKSEKILNLARQNSNSDAERVSLDAIAKSQSAKQKNLDNLNALNAYLKNLDDVLAYIKTGKDGAELKLERFTFENRREEWLKSKDELIQERYKKPNLFANNLYNSIKTKAPPPLPGKKFDELLPGDVLLIDRDTSKLSMSYWINKGDEIFSSTKSSSASHTVIYLKTINGQKMFLDNVPGKGPTIISEQEYVYLYGNRDAKVAQLMEPLQEKDGEKLYQVARQLADEQLKLKSQQSNSLLADTKYGLSYSGTEMVCSEASRWVLIKAGKYVPETEDKIKKMVGMEYSPADFCKSKYFIVTPLYGVPKSGN